MTCLKATLVTAGLASTLTGSSGFLHMLGAPSLGLRPAGNAISPNQCLGTAHPSRRRVLGPLLYAPSDTEEDEESVEEEDDEDLPIIKKEKKPFLTFMEDPPKLAYLKGREDWGVVKMAPNQKIDPELGDPDMVVFRFHQFKKDEEAARNLAELEEYKGDDYMTYFRRGMVRFGKRKTAGAMGDMTMMVELEPRIKKYAWFRSVIAYYNDDFFEGGAQAAFSVWEQGGQQTLSAIWQFMNDCQDENMGFRLARGRLPTGIKSSKFAYLNAIYGLCAGKYREEDLLPIMRFGLVEDFYVSYFLGLYFEGRKKPGDAEKAREYITRAVLIPQFNIKKEDNLFHTVHAIAAYNHYFMKGYNALTPEEQNYMDSLDEDEDFDRIFQERLPAM